MTTFLIGVQISLSFVGGPDVMLTWRFATSFLGDANFFVGQVGPDGVETAGGLVRLEKPLSKRGSTVTVAVRLEKMTIQPVGVPVDGLNSIEATLRDIIYAGAVSTFILRTADGSEIKVFNQNAEAPALAPGTPVSVTWPRNRTILLEP